MFLIVLFLPPIRLVNWFMVLGVSLFDLTFNGFAMVVGEESPFSSSHRVPVMCLYTLCMVVYLALSNESLLVTYGSFFRQFFGC